jgi:hypothetical protein
VRYRTNGRISDWYRIPSVFRLRYAMQLDYDNVSSTSVWKFADCKKMPREAGH